MVEKKLGMPSVVATGVGLIVATSCLMSLGQGAGAIGLSFVITMALACVINMCTALSVAELNAVMPNLTGGLAQYTLASMGPFVAIVSMVGGYLVCNVLTGSVECAMFGNSINSVFDTGLPASFWCIALLVILIVANLRGIDMFAKIQNFVAYGMIISLILMGVIGCFKLGTGEVVSQPMVLSWDSKDIFSLLGLAFFLFLGSDFVIPIAKDVKNARRNIPFGMLLSLTTVFIMQTIVIIGMHNYTNWAELSGSVSPHIFYGHALLGNVGSYWMIIVSIFAVISTVNTVMNSIPYICVGMAKIGLLPEIFAKRNKHGAPYVGILLFGGIMIIINATGLSTADKLSFFILVGSVFTIICYIISNINVLMLRYKMPKLPRTFKVPFGPVIPIIGIIGDVFIIANISGDLDTRKLIYEICIAVFVLLAIYSFVWIKKVMKKQLFKPYEIKEVMAMENELYMITRKKKKKEGKA